MSRKTIRVILITTIVIYYKRGLGHSAGFMQETQDVHCGFGRMPMRSKCSRSLIITRAFMSHPRYKDSTHEVLTTFSNWRKG